MRAVRRTLFVHPVAIRAPFHTWVDQYSTLTETTPLWESVRIKFSRSEHYGQFYWQLLCENENCIEFPFYPARDIRCCRNCFLLVCSYPQIVREAAKDDDELWYKILFPPRSPLSMPASICMLHAALSSVQTQESFNQKPAFQEFSFSLQFSVFLFFLYK